MLLADISPKLPGIDDGELDFVARWDDADKFFRDFRLDSLSRAHANKKWRPVRGDDTDPIMAFK